MKRLWILGLLAFVSLLVWGNDLDKSNILGNVQSILEMTFDLVDKDGEWVNVVPWKSQTISFYNIQGNITEYRSSNASGMIKKVYSYDSQGNKTLIQFYDGNQNMYQYTILRYDMYGHLFESTAFDNQGIILAKNKHENDAQGNAKKISTFKNDGTILYRYEYTYNESNYLIEDKQYNSNGNLLSKKSYKYDEHGNISEIEIYNEEEMKITRYVYIYDNRDNLIESIIKNDYKADIKYRYKYTYDNNGNWDQMITTREIAKNGNTYLEPIEVTLRVITYFE